MKFMIFSKKFLHFLENRCIFINIDFFLSVPIALAILCCTSLEFKFKLSERIQMKLSMKGRMVMIVSGVVMVMAGVYEVYHAEVIF